jgi:hypothetical protein
MKWIEAADDGTARSQVFERKTPMNWLMIWRRKDGGDRGQEMYAALATLRSSLSAISAVESGRTPMPPKAESFAGISHGDYTDIFACVGRLVVPFASVEASVDKIIAAISQKGGKVFEIKPSKGLCDRIDYIEEGLKTLPILADVRDEGLAVLNALRTEAKVRNHIVHSYVSNFDAKNKVAEFTMLDSHLDKQMNTEVVRHYSLRNLSETGLRTTRLGNRIHALAERIIQLLAPKNCSGGRLPCSAARLGAAHSQNALSSASTWASAGSPNRRWLGRLHGRGRVRL